MTLPLLACAVAGVLVSAFLPFLAVPVLRKIQVIDVETERSSHRGVALRGLGVAPWGGVAVAFACTLLSSPSESWHPVFAMGAALAIGLVGFTEDLVGLSIRVRAGLQLLVGVLLSAAVGLLENGGILAVLVFGAFFVAYVNVTNFMDGINGISGIHGVVVGISFAAVGLFEDVGWLVMLGVLIAGAFGAFIVWNVGSELRFLGDVGSYLLGGIVAATVIAAYSVGVPLWALVSPLLLYISDSAYTLLRRLASRKRWYEAHREHVYQRLAASPGLGHITVAALYGVMAAVLAIVGAIVLVVPDAVPALIVAQAGLIAGFFVASERRLASANSDSRGAAAL